MITPSGYTNDPVEMAEGIAITFSEKIAKFNECSMPALLKVFERCMRKDDGIWLHRCKHKPKVDIADIYIIVAGVFMYRASYGGFENGAAEIVRGNGSIEVVEWPRLLVVGPAIKAPVELKFSGFRSFRYTSKLF